MEHLPTIILVFAIIGIVGYLLHRNKDSVKEFLGKFFTIKMKDRGKRGNSGNAGNTGNADVKQNTDTQNTRKGKPTIIDKRYKSGYLDQLSEYDGVPLKSFALPLRSVFARLGEEFTICLNREGWETETNYLLAESQYSDTVSRNAYFIMRIDGHICIALGDAIEYDKNSGDCYDPDSDRDICPICYYSGGELCHTDCLMLKDGIRFLLGKQWFMYRKDDFNEEQIDEAFTSRRTSTGSRRQPNSGTPVAPDSNLGRRVFKALERKITGNGEYPFN